MPPNLPATGSPGRFEVGIVDQDDEHLAVHVLALEIVPAALGRVDTVADEHQRRVGDDRPASAPLSGASTAISVPCVERNDCAVLVEADLRRADDLAT